MDIVNKQPSEKFTITLDFTDRLPTSVTVSSGVVTAKDARTGVADTSVYSSGTLSITSPTAAAVLQAGTDGTDYQVTYTVTLSDGSVLQEDFILKVRREHI